MDTRKLPTFYLAGIKIRTSNQHEQAAQDIPKLWHRFMEVDMASQIINKIEENIYCVYTDYEGDWQDPYTCFLGCKIADPNDAPEGMAVISVDESDYLVKRLEGMMSEDLVGKAWREIWQSDIKRKYTTDFELYSEDFDPEKAKVEIFLAV